MGNSQNPNKSQWANALGPSKGEDTVWDSPSDTEPHVGDTINSPPHYTAAGIEAIDVIEAFAPQYAEGEYLIGSVFKYLCRAPFKGKLIQDLKKARWFLDRAIAEAEANE